MASEAGAPPEGAPAPVPRTKVKLSKRPVAEITHLKDFLPAIREVVGEKNFDVFSGKLIGVSDDGQHLTLGQPSRWLADFTERFADVLAETMGRHSVDIIVVQSAEVSLL